MRMEETLHFLEISADEINSTALTEFSSNDAIREAAQQSWIVDNLIARDSIAWFYGKPGSYKSFIIMDMALHIAAGKPWMGRDVDQGPVLWLAAEGGVDIHYRRRAWEARHGVETMFHLQHVDLNLLEDHSKKRIQEYATNSVERVIEKLMRQRLSVLFEEEKEGSTDNTTQIKKLCDALDISADAARHHGVEAAQQRYHQYSGYSDRKLYRYIEGSEPLWPRLIVLDTFAQTSGNASTGPEVTEYIRRLKRNIAAIGNGCAVAVIDHTTKGGDSYMGALAKEGDSDLMAKIELESDFVSTVKVKPPHGKLKFAPAPDDIPIALELQVVTDADGHPVVDLKGRPIESLVCTDGTKQKRLAEITKADSNSPQALLLALLQAKGSATPESEIREVFLDLPAMTAKKPATAKQAYLRAKKALADDGLISISDDGLISVT